MDTMILAEKLESLRRCVSRLKQKRAPTSADLMADVDRQDILSLNLTCAVQLCVDMASHILSANQAPAPASMSQAFDSLEKLGLIDAALASHLKAAVGFRNVAVHAYQVIDWESSTRLPGSIWKNLQRSRVSSANGSTINKIAS